MNLNLNVPSRQLTYTSGSRGQDFHCKIENKDTEPADLSLVKIDVSIPETITVEPVSTSSEFPYDIKTEYTIEPGKSFNPSFRVKRSSDIRREKLREDTFEMYLYYDGEVVDVKEVEVYG